MIIIGIDPGTLVTGYGLVERQGNSITLLAVGIIKNRPAVSMPLRLKNIYDSLTEVMDRYHPDELAIETAFYSKNAQSALKIGQARGVSILAGVNGEIPVTEYTPREVKKAVVGNGAASKDQVQYMMMQFLKIKNKPASFDATDALAVAVCHAHKITAPRKGFRNWKSFIEAYPERVSKISTKK